MIGIALPLGKLSPYLSKWRFGPVWTDVDVCCSFALGNAVWKVGLVRKEEGKKGLFK